MEPDSQSKGGSNASTDITQQQKQSSPSSCEVVPADEPEIQVESTKLIAASAQKNDFATSTHLTSCVKCKANEFNKNSAYYSGSNHEKAVHIPNFQGGRMSVVSVAQRHHQDSTLSEVATCVSCIQRNNGLGGTECCRVFKSYWGILFSLVSGLASTFGGIIVRHMKDFHPFSLATYRFQGIVLPTLIIVGYYYFVKKQNVFESIWPVKDKEKLMKFGFTIIRAVIGCLGLYLYFYAIKLMPLADAKVILSCRPVFVIFVAHIFLGEPCGIFPVLAAMLSMIGVGVISRPPVLTGNENFDADTLMGTIFATLAMLAGTLSMVVLRYLRGVHVAVVTLAFGIWGTILSLACSATVERFDVPQSGHEWLLMFCLAISAFFSQTAITLAMKYEHAGAVVIVGTCDTIMSFVLQYLILGDSPDIYSLLGATLIIVCVSLITLRKWLNSLPERHSIRKYLWFVLK